VLLDRKPAETGALPRVLAADDQPQILEALTLLLQPAGFHVDYCRSPEAALQALRNSILTTRLLMDLNYTRDTTSGHERAGAVATGFWKSTHTSRHCDTAWASVELAVEAMRRGARDFIAKPWENARLLTVVQNQVTTLSNITTSPTAGGRKPVAAGHRPTRDDRRVGSHAARFGCHWREWAHRTQTS